MSELAVRVLLREAKRLHEQAAALRRAATEGLEARFTEQEAAQLDRDARDLEDDARRL